jgi:hypothetical protein
MALILLLYRLIPNRMGGRHTKASVSTSSLSLQLNTKRRFSLDHVVDPARWLLEPAAGLP